MPTVPRPARTDRHARPAREDARRPRSRERVPVRSRQPPARPPQYPHPDAVHEANSSGRGLHPCFHLHPLADELAWYEEQGREPEIPVDGDETARLRALQRWDDSTGRLQQKTYTGTEPCENPDCPHPQPHSAGQWFTDNRPHYRDIAHTLYPAGRLPKTLPPEPVQLDLLADLFTT